MDVRRKTDTPPLPKVCAAIPSTTCFKSVAFVGSSLLGEAEGNGGVALAGATQASLASAENSTGPPSSAAPRGGAIAPTAAAAVIARKQSIQERKGAPFLSRSRHKKSKSLQKNKKNVSKKMFLLGRVDGVGGWNMKHRALLHKLTCGLNELTCARFNKT